MNPTLRTATHADIAAVDALLARSYPVLLKPDYPPSVIVSVIPLISRAQPALVTCGTYFVVDVDGCLMAAGGWTATGPRSARQEAGLCHVRHVVTDARATRQGHGRRLLSHVMATARAAGHTRIEALSTLTAVPFYDAMGFVVREEVAVPIGALHLPFQAVRMDAML